MTYDVQISEPAELETDEIYFWMLQRSPDTAVEWYDGFLRAIRSLSSMPRRHPVAREYMDSSVEVRRMLYGRGRNAYRVLYTIIESSDRSEQPVVRIMHVRHASRRDIGEE